MAGPVVNMAMFCVSRSNNIYGLLRTTFQKSFSFNQNPLIFATPKGNYLFIDDGAVAQLVEQRTENPCVAGSIPAHTTEQALKLNASKPFSFGTT